MSMAQVLLYSGEVTERLFRRHMVDLDKRSRVLAHNRGILMAKTLNISSIIILSEFSLPLSGFPLGDTDKTQLSHMRNGNTFGVSIKA